MRPRWSWRRRLIVGAGAVVVLIVAVYVYLDYLTEREVREAVAEADRLDPGWRFEKMEGAREEIPDAENSALIVLAARARIPKQVPGQPGPFGVMHLFTGRPPHRRAEADVRALRDEVARAATALDTAEKLADLPRGRYRVVWNHDLIGTPMPHVHQPLELTNVLVLDARLRAVNGDMDGALRVCRAAMNAGRSLGDEPSTISQLTRAAGGQATVSALGQVLTWGEASPESLERLQRLLEAEAEAPLQLTAARSERVSYYQCLEVMRRGQFDRAQYRLQSSMLGARADDVLDRGRARSCEAAFLHYSNEVVEIAKLPPAAQHERLQALAIPTRQLPKLLEALSRGADNWSHWATLFHLTKAKMRCAAVALAAERYRLVEKHWPNNLDALVPRYLAEVPLNPFDGGPLHWRRLPDGAVVFCVVPDWVDEGTNLDRQRAGTAAKDVGFELWDPGLRGVQPAPK
jgi:hypothetical protein